MEYDRTRSPEDWDEEHWARIFRSVISWTAQPKEDIDDILAGASVLAVERSRLLGRDFEFWQDIPYVLSLFCWWPWKPSLSIASRKYLLKMRGRLFDGTAKHQTARDRLIDAVPREMLTMDTQELFERLENDPIESVVAVRARVRTFLHEE
jgi:hypothetical protein